MNMSKTPRSLVLKLLSKSVYLISVFVSIRCQIEHKIEWYCPFSSCWNILFQQKQHRKRADLSPWTLWQKKREWCHQCVRAMSIDDIIHMFSLKTAENTPIKNRILNKKGPNLDSIYPVPCFFWLVYSVIAMITVTK